MRSEKREVRSKKLEWILCSGAGEQHSRTTAPNYASSLSYDYTQDRFGAGQAESTEIQSAGVLGGGHERVNTND